MSFILNFFNTLLKKCAALSPAFVLGSLFAVTLLAFFTGFVLSFFIKKVRQNNKHFFFSFSNFTSLTALVYCLAESYYIGKTFTLTSALLTVGLFYMFSQLKYVLLPANSKEKTNVKKILKSGFKEIKPYSKNAFLSKPVLNNNDFLKNSIEFEKNNAEFNNILNKLKKAENPDINKDSVTLPSSNKDIELSNIKNFTGKLKDKELSFYDKSELDKLDRMSEDFSLKKLLNFQDVEILNDCLLSLLKMMSKYNV